MSTSTPWRTSHAVCNCILNYHGSKRQIGCMLSQCMRLFMQEETAHSGMLCSCWHYSFGAHIMGLPPACCVDVSPRIIKSGTAILSRVPTQQGKRRHGSGLRMHFKSHRSIRYIASEIVWRLHCGRLVSPADVLSSSFARAASRHSKQSTN